MKPAKALAVAASGGDLAAMNSLLVADPDLAKDWQPLMDACFAGQVAAAELLLDRGADPNVVSRSAFKYRPLHRTIERKVTLPRNENHVAVVRLLLERGADPQARATMAQVSAVAMAALSGESRFLELLLPHVPEPDIFTAAVMGDAAGVERLLKQDASQARALDQNGWNALRFCCASRVGDGNPEAAASLERIAALLLEHGTGVDGCLDSLIYGNRPGLARLLLERGATVSDGDTLNHAACDGAFEALDLLIEHGVDLNLTDGTEHHGGYTPFGCTLTMRSLQGARWFLDHGADPNYVGGKAGESSFHVAVRSGCGPAVLKLLSERGADPDARDSAGISPLAAARAKHQRSAVDFLLSVGSRD